MSSENNDENFSSYDEKSRKCIEKLDLTENELTTIHKAIIVIKKTCNSIKNITYNTDESAKEQFNEQIKLNHKLQVENDELMKLYKEADSCNKDLKLKYDTLKSIVNKPPSDQNQEISTPPTVETIKSSTNCETSSSDSDFDELEREIFDLSDNSTKSNPFQLKKPHVKKNNKKNSDNDYEEYDSDDHQQQSKFQNIKQKESLIEKGKQLCRILSNSSNDDDQIQRKSFNSSQEISNALSIINNDQISIIDIDTAKSRLLQWKNQGSQCELIQNEIHRYKLYHLKMLHDIYNDLVNLGQKLNTNKKTAIGDVKTWVASTIKTTLKVTKRTERRYRSGCTRIKQLLDIGITYQQLVEAGCTPTTFYVHNSHYKMFLLQLPAHIRRNISAQSSSLTNFTSLSTSKAIVKSNKKARLTESSTIVINDDETVVNENITKSKGLERKIGDKKQPVAFTALLLDKKRMLPRSRNDNE
ncbi:unnamed protein product [Rhizophagus irregularis]|nr:unnamed protein product [Rhizophagus irregularis]